MSWQKCGIEREVEVVVCKEQNAGSRRHGTVGSGQERVGEANLVGMGR